MRNDRGTLLTLAIVLLFVFGYAMAGVSTVFAANWLATLQQDADRSAALALRSASNEIHTMMTTLGPEVTEERLKTGYDPAEPNRWHYTAIDSEDPLDTKTSCMFRHGCWFAEVADYYVWLDNRRGLTPDTTSPRAKQFRVLGRKITVTVAARCAQNPKKITLMDVADAERKGEDWAHDAAVWANLHCKTVEQTTLRYAPVPLPVHNTIVAGLGFVECDVDINVFLRRLNGDPTVMRQRSLLQSGLDKTCGTNVWSAALGSDALVESGAATDDLCDGTSGLVAIAASVVHCSGDDGFVETLGTTTLDCDSTTPAGVSVRHGHGSFFDCGSNPGIHEYPSEDFYCKGNRGSVVVFGDRTVNCTGSKPVVVFTLPGATINDTLPFPDPLPISDLTSDACMALPTVYERARDDIAAQHGPLTLPGIGNWLDVQTGDTKPVGRAIHVVDHDIGIVGSEPTIYLVNNPNTTVTVVLNKHPDTDHVHPVAVVASGSVTVQYRTDTFGDLVHSSSLVSIIAGCHVYLDPEPDALPRGLIDNVAMIAAGGLWSTLMEPIYACSPPTMLATVKLQGVVIAGQPPYLFNECHDGINLVKRYGVERESSLPDDWAGQDAAYWPGRDGSGWVLQ